MQNKEIILKSLRADIASADATLHDFRTSISGNDVLYHLSWGDKAFKAAATVKVYSYAVKVLEDMVGLSNLEAMIDNVHDHIMSGARHIPSSSSQCSNLAEAHETAAHTELYRYLTVLKG